MTMKFKPVHPFPARMAPAIVCDKLSKLAQPMKILDPMAGSGTTLAIARSSGHYAYGVDRDPLAIILATVWCSDIDSNKLLGKAEEVLDRALNTEKSLRSEFAYPSHADDETKAFIKFWFDTKNRKQLTALSKHIGRIHDKVIQNFLWTAFSRMIITKKIGVSLGMDISHSRPHIVYDKAPVEPFDIFLKEVAKVTKANPFSVGNEHPQATISCGDSRALEFEDGFFDLVITSPPYLNAIDYLRGHKLSLVWMKNSIERIRNLRATNIGTEVKSDTTDNKIINKALQATGDYKKLDIRQQGFLTRYAIDMDAVCSEVGRVLKKNGKAIFVVGDSTLKGVFVSNSKMIVNLFKNYGLDLENIEERKLEDNRRYLPPPTKKKSGKQLRTRMRKEVILTLKKVS